MLKPDRILIMHEVCFHDRKIGIMIDACEKAKADVVQQNKRTERVD